MQRMAFLLLRRTLVALVLAAMGLGAYLWTGADHSLGASLNLAARLLPEGQSLETREVTGSLRSGGRIGWLRWRQGQLSVEARDTELVWSLRSLLDSQLPLQRLSVRHLRIEDQRPPTPATPPGELMLPIQVEVSFEVTTLEWAGSAPVVVNGLFGKYTFNSKQHRIDAGKASISSGNYRFSGELQATAPLDLALRLQGEVLTTPPGSPHTVTLVASAEAQGALAGVDASVEVSARLEPQTQATPQAGRNGAAAGPPASAPMQATVTTRIQPWQPQPVVSAQGAWQALDLAALWPQAPRTLLQGQASVTPQAQGWLGQVELSNALPGPWNRQQLPVSRLNARARYAAGQWIIESLDAAAAGGQIQAQGQVNAPSADANPAPGATTPAAAWNGRASFRGINPAAADSRLAAAVLNGTLAARLEGQAWVFETDLNGVQAASGAAPPRLGGLRLDRLQVQGRWDNGHLTLPTLLVQIDDAQLQGSVAFNPTSHSGDARLRLSLPGGTATLAGSFGETRGDGALALALTDAAQATRWIARWPGMPADLAKITVRGSATLAASWRGGWQDLGRQIQVQAELSVPRLELGAPGADADEYWTLADGRLALAGSPAALRLNTQAKLAQGERTFEVKTAAQGGRASEDTWKAQIETLQVRSQSTHQPGTWTLQLGQPLTVDLKDAPVTRTLQVTPGELRLTGPMPGEARIEWQSARWSQRDGAPARWSTQGRLHGMPLGWAERLAGLGLKGLEITEDVVLGGQWDVASGDTLRARASLERTQGDIQVTLDDASSSTINAGVRTARIDLHADNGEFDLRALWDSERAGRAQASFTSKLKRQADGWAWPADTAIEGKLQVKLPRLRALAALTPPGWRVRGTLEANATINGTRAVPYWDGTIAADNLALRSVVEGLEFSQGKLRARLEKQRLDITEFSLLGASSAAGPGGRLNLSGFALWPALKGGDSTGLAGVKMELEAKAEALRVSTRADRRMVVSGTINAKLADARLQVRGGIKVDQALIILPEEIASGLGADVVIATRPTGTAPTAGVTATAAPPTATEPAGPRQQLEQDVSVTLDLGPDFQLRGQGLSTRLAGLLTVSSRGTGMPQPRLTGEIRTLLGTYRAYGQRLDIEEGVLRFTGPFDNPALDILAIRPNLTQRVGVQITGTARSPRVRLFSDPVLSEAETLSWLLLGRSGANGGAEAAMLQRAALALLGGSSNGLSGQLTQALGLDELSVRSQGDSADGNATGATIMVGKRLARNFYVAYEQALSGAMGSFQIFYDLTSRLTLRAQIGQQSVIDLIYTVRFDHASEIFRRPPDPRQLQSSPKPP
jgi:translocation and assembly module TamB